MVPSKSIRIFLNSQLFLFGYGYRQHESGKSGIRIRTFFNPLSRMKILEYVMYPEKLNLTQPRTKCRVRLAWLIQRLIYRLEQTSICTQLFAGHLVGFRPMRRKKNLHQMVTLIALFYSSTVPPDSLLCRHQKLFGYIA